jgi:hypothetical protein
MTLQGKAVWVLGFFSFLAGLNAITAIILAIDVGIEGVFQPYLIGSFTGGIPVYVYLIVSILATLLFLGATSIRAITELSNKAMLEEIISRVNTIESSQKLQQKLLESLQARVFLVDESINSMRKEVAKAFTKQSEDLKLVQADLVKKFNSELVVVKGEMTKQINSQRGEIKKIDSNLADVKDELAGQLAGLASNMESHERRNRKSEKAIMKQEEEIGDIKMKMELLEAEFVPQKPLLTSQCKVEDVRGIGENTGNMLREIGITDVGELILADPKLIAEKIEMSEKTVEKLQGRAQLAMVPGVKEKDLILLEEAEVMNRRELAEQNPLELGMKINGISKIYVQDGKIAEAERPTIEEVYNWIKAAKT